MPYVVSPVREHDPHDPPHDQRINRAVSLLRIYDPNGPIQWNSAGQIVGESISARHIALALTQNAHTRVQSNTRKKKNWYSHKPHSRRTATDNWASLM